MRAAFQILAIPYRVADGCPLYCVFHRQDDHQWQFIAGGGEDAETPAEAARREVLEEGGVQANQWIALESLCYLPVTAISEQQRRHWKKNIYVIPEYAFGFACPQEIQLSQEHTQCLWLPYEKARSKLSWDSNRTALFELHCRLGEELWGISRGK